MAGRRPALQQNWQSSEKSQHFKEKAQYLMNTLYFIRKIDAMLLPPLFQTYLRNLLWNFCEKYIYMKDVC